MLDWSNAINAGQMIVAIISVFTTFATCLTFVMVIKSDVRSLRDTLAFVTAEVSAVKVSMKEQTEILRQQDRHEVEITHLKLQVQALSDELGNRRFTSYIGTEMPRHSGRRDDPK